MSNGSSRPTAAQSEMKLCFKLAAAPADALTNKTHLHQPEEERGSDNLNKFEHHHVAATDGTVLCINAVPAQAALGRII